MAGAFEPKCSMVSKGFESPLLGVSRGLDFTGFENGMSLALYSVTSDGLEMGLCSASE